MEKMNETYQTHTNNTHTVKTHIAEKDICCEKSCYLVQNRNSKVNGMWNLVGR